MRAPGARLRLYHGETALFRDQAACFGGAREEAAHQREEQSWHALVCTVVDVGAGGEQELGRQLGAPITVRSYYPTKYAAGGV